MTREITSAAVRRWLWTRQGFGGRLLGRPPAEALSVGGWSRSVGGASPYLAIHARTGASRAAIDLAMADLSLHELPSARGCTYVLPAADFAHGLLAGQGHTDETQIAQAKKYCGVTDAEIDRLCSAILDAVAGEPLEPDDIKKQTGDAVRHLGENGKKRGLTTTLALGLGRLQQRGLIRRVPIGGRLDQQRYRYVAWANGPLEGVTLTAPEIAASLAQRYFQWAAPASVSQFAWWAGMSQKAARAAVAELDLTPIAEGDERLIPTDDRSAFLDVAALGGESDVALVGSLDNMGHLRRDIDILLESSSTGHPLLHGPAMATGGNLSELPHHAILDRGELIGLWDYDINASAIVWRTFGRPTETVRAAVDSCERFVRDQLGDARSFSLDSPKSRQGRLDALRRGA